MKITIDPMPALRAAKIEKINTIFNTMAALNLHRDQAYAQKRAWAVVGDQQLSSEAALRGVTVTALAQLILSKPDIVAERELQRQAVMMMIDRAKTPAGIDAVRVGNI